MEHLGNIKKSDADILLCFLFLLMMSTPEVNLIKMQSRNIYIYIYFFWNNSICHGPVKPTCLDALFLNNLFFKLPKPLFFHGFWGLMVWSAFKNEFSCHHDATLQNVDSRYTCIEKYHSHTFFQYAIYSKFPIKSRKKTEINQRCIMISTFFFQSINHLKKNVDVSENRGYPQIIHFNRVFHYKPSILGYPYFWKHPCEQPWL